MKSQENNKSLAWFTKLDREITKKINSGLKKTPGTYNKGKNKLDGLKELAKAVESNDIKLIKKESEKIKELYVSSVDEFSKSLNKEVQAVKDWANKVASIKDKESFVNACHSYTDVCIAMAIALVKESEKELKKICSGIDKLYESNVVTSETFDDLLKEIKETISMGFCDTRGVFNATCQRKDSIKVLVLVDENFNEIKDTLYILDARNVLNEKHRWIEMDYRLKRDLTEEEINRLELPKVKNNKLIRAIEGKAYKTLEDLKKKKNGTTVFFLKNVTDEVAKKAGL